MPPEVLVIFYDGKIYKAQRLLAMRGADSTNPEDYGLPSTHQIITVILSGQIGNVYVNGILQHLN